MTDKITDWLNHLRLDHMPNTVNRYEFHIRRLAEWADPRQVEDLTTSELYEYLAFRRENGSGDSSIKVLVGALRTFYRYIRPDDSPSQSIRFPKVHHRLQRVLDDEAILKIMAACDTSKPTGMRDLAIISLMLDSGLRATELCTLKLVDLDLEHRRFKVIVKGGHEGLGIFSIPTAMYLSIWLEVRPKIAADGVKTVFVSERGNRPGTSMTREGLVANFRRLARSAGINEFSPHDLRRTFATMATRNGAPTRVLQVAGRWESTRMIDLYTQTVNAGDFEKYLPVATLLHVGKK